MFKRLFHFRLENKALRRAVWGAAGLGACGGLFVALANLAVIAGARGRMYWRADEIPARPVALVLGTSQVTDYFDYRLKAAARLYKAGKVRHLLVSGDNHIRSYDEPTEMKAGLIRLGVPAEAITCDYAGFRTLDSVARARRIFGVRELTIVSQKFHNYRALAIARHYGIDAVVFNARDVKWHEGMKIELREALARPLALLDLYVWHRGPRLLGPKEPIQLTQAPPSNKMDWR